MPQGDGPSGQVFQIETYKEILNSFYSNTLSPRADIFAIEHCLVDLYEDFQIVPLERKPDPAFVGVKVFSIGFYRKTVSKDISCKTTRQNSPKRGKVFIT